MSFVESARASQSWRLREQYLWMKPSNCLECGRIHFPPRRICPDCGYDRINSLPQKNEKK